MTEKSKTSSACATMPLSIPSEALNAWKLATSMCSNYLLSTSHKCSNAKIAHLYWLCLNRGLNGDLKYALLL